MTFRVFFVHFLALFFLKLSFDRAKKSTFIMSVGNLAACPFFLGISGGDSGTELSG